MMTIPFHDEQLQYMCSLAASRPEWLNPFFLFLNYFDTPWFYFVIIPVVWLGISYQWGLRIFFWLSLNSLVNSVAKYLVGWPRPSTEMPNIALIHPTSNGFPSGGAQSSLFLGALLFYYGKTRAAKAVAVAYVLLVSYSRIYLGVHYPLDVLGGWAIAAVLAWAFIEYEGVIEKFLKKQRYPVLLVMSIAIPVMLTFFIAGISYLVGAMIGIGLGSVISIEYGLFLKAPKNERQALGRIAIGLLAIFGLMLVWPPLLYQAFVVSFFMSVALSPICRRISG